MPRPYRLGKRAGQMQATRARIVEAAIELYIEVGISGTTMRQVGIRADVAPGTLRSHFPTRRALDEAMVERVTAEIPLPDDSLFDGADSLEERVRRLIVATGRFLDRADRLYRMWLREPMLTSPWTETGAAYGARWDALQRIALGPLGDDPDARAVVRAVMEPPFFDSIRGGTRTTADASTLIAEAIVPWLAARAASVDG